MSVLLPKEIIDHILSFGTATCRVCGCRFHSQFFMTYGGHLYCSQDCYNFI